MFKKIENQPIPLILATALSSLLLAGCELTVPASDSTPPTVSLAIGGLGPTITVDEASGPVSRTVPSGVELLMLASGRDSDGGVKNVGIVGAGTISCTSSEIGQAVSIHYLANNPEDPAVGVGDEALDQRLTTLEIKIDELGNLCGNGRPFTFSGAFQATVENFHGGTANTPNFNLTHP